MWYDDDEERPIGPTAGFKDYVRLRKSQGYNWVSVIAAFPNWITDDKPSSTHFLHTVLHTFGSCGIWHSVVSCVM